jgi:hypothetical protein
MEFRSPEYYSITILNQNFNNAKYCSQLIVITIIVYMEGPILRRDTLSSLVLPYLVFLYFHYI